MKNKAAEVGEKVGKTGKATGAKGKSSGKKKGEKRTKQKQPRRAAQKYNPYICPDGMSLEDWQRALRCQAAMRDDHLAVQAPDKAGDPFKVVNIKKQTEHLVEYYGPKSEYNVCSCLDFKTSGLGTCKHIEAIGIAADGRYARKRYAKPSENKLYIDYVEGRRIRLMSRGENGESIKRLSLDYGFDEEGYVLEREGIHEKIVEFIAKARDIDPGFVTTDETLDIIITLRQNKARKKVLEDKYTSSSLDGLLKASLYPYQREGIKFGFEHGRVLIADEMGLGKTIQGIGVAELLMREGFVNNVLVVCPTSLKYQWKREIERFSGKDAEIVEGNLMQRRKIYGFDVPYRICSYNSMLHDVKGGTDIKADLIIYDEVQRLKNWDTQIAKAARSLKSDYVVALSGTPLENKITELYSVMELVDQYALAPYYKFIADTTERDVTGRVVGYRNLNHIAERLAPYLIRRRKKDVALQMPPRTDKTLFVPMTKEQMEIHSENQFTVARLIEKWRRTMFLSEKDRKKLLMSLSIMRMVCDSTFVLDQRSRHDTKIAETMHIIDEMISNGDEKVVIFSQWERMLRIMAQSLDKEKIGYRFLHGGVPSAKRPELIEDFLENPQCRVFLSTDAGSTGLNLQAASVVVNLDLPWNPAVLEQRIARVFRLGQSKPVEVINMVARDTIEERMLTTLDFKTGLAEGILDNGEDAIFLEQKKFDKIVETIESAVAPDDTRLPVVINEDEDEDKALILNDGNIPDKPASTEPEQEFDDADAGVETDDETPKQNPYSSGESDSGDSHAVARGREGSGHAGAAPGDEADARQIMAQGVDFLGKFARALSEPGGAAKLADALVEVDPATGKSSLRIPVADKSIVANFFSALGSLLNANK